MSSAGSKPSRGAPSRPARSRARPGRAALRREIRGLARDFADRIVELLDRHGLWEPSAAAVATAEGASPRRSKRQRRSADELSELGERIEAVLEQRRGPVAISVIAAALGAEPRDIAHPVALLVEQGRVEKSGERRGTRYRLAARRRASRRRRRKPPPSRKTKPPRSR